MYKYKIETDYSHLYPYGYTSELLHLKNVYDLVLVLHG